MKSLGLTLLVFGVALLPSACASGHTRLEAGTRVDLPSDGPELGPVEAAALSHLESMITILATPDDDPQETVMSLGRYLDANREAIVGLARQIEARIAQMTRAERTYYEERFAAYFAEANQRWIEVATAFRQAHPEAAVRIDGLMLYFD